MQHIAAYKKARKVVIKLLKDMPSHLSLQYGCLVIAQPLCFRCMDSPV